MPDRWRRRWLAVLVATGAVVIAGQLCVPPIVGLANNGDFEKIMGRVGLRYPPGMSREQKYFGWVNETFVVDRPWWKSPYRTSEALLVRLATFLARRLGNGRTFDLRWLGALHAGLFLGALTLLFGALLRRGVAGLAASATALFFFTDVGYVAPMNSIYSQEASFLALFGLFAVLAGAVVRGGFSVGLAAAYFGCAAFFVSSKPQESFQAAVLAAFGIWMMADEPPAVSAAGFAGAAVLLSVGLWTWSVVPRSMREGSLRKAIFSEILPRSADAEGDLSAMHLDPRWAGRTPESLESDPRFVKELRFGVSHGDLLIFYLRHPRITTSRLSATARKAMQVRPPGLGNFPSGRGFREGQPSTAFALWSSIRARAEPSGPIVLVGIFGAAVAAAIAGFRRRRNALAGKALLLLVFLGMIAFGVCALAGSASDIERHLFVFDTITDALVALGAGTAVAGILGHLGAGNEPAPPAAG